MLSYLVTTARRKKLSTMEMYLRYCKSEFRSHNFTISNLRIREA